jgi:hypothetical protein
MRRKIDLTMVDDLATVGARDRTMERSERWRFEIIVVRTFYRDAAERATLPVSTARMFDGLRIR